MILDKRFDHPSAPLFQALNWLPFFQRCNYHMGVLIYKAFHNLAPVYLSNLLINETDASANYNLRSKNRNDIPHPLIKSRYTKNTFQYSAMVVWNEIPVQIRTCDKLDTFRKHYRNYLLGKHI